MTSSRTNRIRTSLLPAVLAMATAGCSATSFRPTGDAGDTVTDGSDKADADFIPQADGPIPCGTTTCASDQFCIVPCCGGAPPMCEPPTVSAEGGVIPMPCVYPPACTADPPYCASSNLDGCGATSDSLGQRIVFCICP
jgi:hypothetical protein